MKAKKALQNALEDVKVSLKLKLATQKRNVPSNKKRSTKP